MAMGGKFLSRAPDALSKAHVPLTSGILIGFSIKDVSASTANTKCKLLVIERSLDILTE